MYRERTITDSTNRIHLFLETKEIKKQSSRQNAMSYPNALPPNKNLSQKHIVLLSQKTIRYPSSGDTDPGPKIWGFASVK
jgi:hypothetical protein